MSQVANNCPCLPYNWTQQFKTCNPFFKQDIQHQLQLQD